MLANIPMRKQGLSANADVSVTTNTLGKQKNTSISIIAKDIGVDEFFQGSDSMSVPVFSESSVVFDAKTT